MFFFRLSLFCFCLVLFIYILAQNNNNNNNNVIKSVEYLFTHREAEVEKRISQIENKLSGNHYFLTRIPINEL